MWTRLTSFIKPFHKINYFYQLRMGHMLNLLDQFGTNLIPGCINIFDFRVADEIGHFSEILFFGFAIGMSLLMLGHLRTHVTEN